MSSTLGSGSNAQLGLGQAGVEVTDWFREQLLAALSDPMFNVPKVFETWMVDKVAVAGLNIPAGQIIGLRSNTVTVYKKASGVLDVANSAAETDVINEEIPAGVLGTTGMIRVTLVGDYLNNTGAAKNLTVKLYLGGTTCQTVGAGGITATAARYPASYQFVIANQGAANSQVVTADQPDFASPASPDPGEVQHLPATVAVDTSQQQTLRVSVTHNAASANLIYTRRYYMIEFL